MTVFDNIEHDQKSHVLPSVFLMKSELKNQKSTFIAKFSPSPRLGANVFFLFTAQAERQPFLRVHSGLSSIFSITTALHAGKYRDFLTGNLP